MSDEQESRRRRQLEEVSFRCSPCRETFKAPPGRIEEVDLDAEPEEVHPWRYFATHARCGRECPQAAWERALFKAWAHATGPRTAEGKAQAIANLKNDQADPERHLRSRFNAMKHGLTARTATYFPAKPGGYAFCAGCDVDRDHCAEQPACIKQTQLFMLTHAAFEQRRPEHLRAVYADLQAAVIATVQQILQIIIADGAKIETPKYYTDEGNLCWVEWTDPATGEKRQIYEISAHPLFKPLGELLSRNNLSLADMGMTQRVVDEEEENRGRLEREINSQESLAKFAAESADSLKALREMIHRSRAKAAADPLLLEYQQEGGA